MEWCNRRILARIHRATLGRLRREIEPVTALDFERFLQSWQHISPRTQLHGSDGTLQIIRQLQGYEISAAAWEQEILARRIVKYDPALLDGLCLSGEVMWARVSPHPAIAENRRVRPTRIAPIALFLREDADWLIPPGDPDPSSLSHAAQDVLQAFTRMAPASSLIWRASRVLAIRSGRRALGTARGRFCHSRTDSTICAH